MPKSDTKAIIDLENRFWQSMVDEDTETSISMLSEKSVVAGAQGAIVLGKEDYRRLAKQAEGRFVHKSYALDDVNVIFPHEDVAVICYTVTVDMEAEGKPMTLKAADATTWVRTDGQWLAALHTESILGNPLGEAGPN